MKKLLVFLAAAVISSAVHAATVTVYNDHLHRMADGRRVHVGACAGPRWVKLGTRVVIGGSRYTVEDRTAKRLNGRWDLWRPWSKRRCMAFGKRSMRVRVLR